MSTQRTITVKAPDGALTISDLRAFLAEFDKATAASDGLKPKARVSFSGRIKSITVTVEHAGQA